MHVNKILISHSSVTFHQSSMHYCAGCLHPSIDLECIYRLAKQQYHSLNPRNANQVRWGLLHVALSGGMLLKSHFASGSSIPVQDL